MCVEKVAETPADAARLRHEGWVLGLAAHPGVVSLVGPPVEAEGLSVVRTRAVPGRPLPAMDELSPAEVAGLGAAVATTVADLHDAGITHGRLSADHIIVAASGRPVLCGFAAATAATAATAARGRPTGAVTADVTALGATLAAVLAAPTDPVSGALARLLDGIGVGRHEVSARRLAERLGDGRWAPGLPARPTAAVPA